MLCRCSRAVLNVAGLERGEWAADGHPKMTYYFFQAQKRLPGSQGGVRERIGELREVDRPLFALVLKEDGDVP